MTAATEGPLRILRVLPFFEPATGFGGSVSHAAAVSERLAAWGHRVRVLTTDHGVDQSVPRNQWVPYRGYDLEEITLSVEPGVLGLDLGDDANWAEACFLQAKEGE